MWGLCAVVGFIIVELVFDINNVPSLATRPEVIKGIFKAHERIDRHTDPRRRFVTVQITPGRNIRLMCQIASHRSLVNSCLIFNFRTLPDLIVICPNP